MHALAATGTYVQTCMQFCIIVTIYIYIFVSNEIIYGYNFVCENGFP